MPESVDPIELLRDAGEEIAAACGHYVADVCTYGYAADDATEIILGRSYPTMRRVTLRNSLGDELAAGGERATEARRVIRVAIVTRMALPEPTLEQIAAPFPRRPLDEAERVPPINIDEIMRKYRGPV